MVRNITSDQKFMRAALAEAHKAAQKGEVPIGAVIVHDGKIIARAHNLRIKNCDASAHAEVEAVRKAGRRLGGWHLDGCTIYVTLEPCAMCAGALINSRISRVVFGASDVRFGCCGSIYRLTEDARFNHRPITEGGILAEECAAVLSAFFRERRAVSK